MEQNLCTPSEIGAALGITARQVRALARRRAIPSIPLGHRTIRFDLKRVREALARLEVREIGARSSPGAIQFKQ